MSVCWMMLAVPLSRRHSNTPPLASGSGTAVVMTGFYANTQNTHYGPGSGPFSDGQGFSRCAFTTPSMKALSIFNSSL